MNETILVIIISGITSAVLAGFGAYVAVRVQVARLIVEIDNLHDKINSHKEMSDRAHARIDRIIERRDVAHQG